MVRSLLAVLIGGVLGTALRLCGDALLVHSDQQFPWSTLIINVLGSFVLAVLVARVWPVAPAWIRAGLGPGLLGGFTTFSAVIASMVTLAASSQVLLALAYLAVTLVLGFGAAALGMWIGTPRASRSTIEVDE
ncbi:MAG TPA: CrcB family protein [Galbitalea sp.]|jgi:CrcB protein